MSEVKVVVLGIILLAGATRGQAEPFTWNPTNVSSIWSAGGQTHQANYSSFSNYIASLGNSVPPPQATPAPAPAPAVTASPAFTPSFSPAPTFAPQALAPSPAHSQVSNAAPDAFINFGNGNYAESNSFLSGSPGSWSSSPSVTRVFGNTPTAQQQADFTNAVLADVRQTFQLSGVSVNLTLDPNAHAAHTISVVSGAAYNLNSNAIGITDVGANGFSFIDKLSFAQTANDLEWADAHNIAHELMHALGVSVHHDQTGNYLDAATANWSLLINPNTTFSSAAVTDILANLKLDHSASALQTGAELLGLPSLPHKPGCPCPLCRRGYELLSPVPAPEPATLAIWFLGTVGVLALRGRRRPVKLAK